MRPLLTVILVLMILSSCTGKNQLPAGIMSKEKMEAVMWDIMQADVFLSDFLLNKDTSLKKLEEHNKLYAKILLIHKTDNESFSRSFNYYRTHPTIMKEVLDSLNTRQVQEIQEQIPPLKIDDSLPGNRKSVLSTPISVQ